MTNHPDMPDFEGLRVPEFGTRFPASDEVTAEVAKIAETLSVTDALLLVAIALEQETYETGDGSKFLRTFVEIARRAVPE